MQIYSLDWQQLTPEQFLRDYWQKKPLLIKGAFKQFQDPLDADELAGLAMESEVESRIIARDPQQQWQVSHGPFSDYESLAESGWTLLVQAVNNWSQQTAQLITPFQFIPNWRIDDVMVSFSTPEGGVGAHLDQYDVFIIQGQGRRHWQVGLPDDTLETLLPHPDLKQVSPFSPCIDAITEPGDLLYIPPNHPHNGVAIENSLNYSVGFQAPSAQELWSGFADKLIDNCQGLERFADSDRTVTTSPQQLSLQDVARLKSFMLAQLSDDNLHELLGCALTQSHHELDLLEPEQLFNEQDIDDICEQAEHIMPVLGIKALQIEAQDLLFINGEKFPLLPETQAFAAKLAQNKAMTISSIKSSLQCLKIRTLLTSVLNKGYWYID